MESWKLSWETLLLLWSEAEEKEAKEKRYSIRFTETQFKLLRDIAWKAGYEDISRYIRSLIRKDLQERAMMEK